MLTGRASTLIWVEVDIAQWMVQSMDRQARRLGITRQPLIEMRLAASLEAR